MSSKVELRFLAEEEYPIWNELVAHAPAGSIYSLPDYLDILCRVTGGRFKILSVWRGEELIGGMGVYEIRTRLGALVKNRPLLYYNGIVLSESRSKYPSQQRSRATKAIKAIGKYLESGPYRWVSLRTRSPLQDGRAFQSIGWNVIPSYSFVVSLKDMTIAWDRVEQNLKRLVKRCTSEGVEFSDDDDFKSFYQMHQRTADRKGAPLYLPEKAFQQYFEQLKALGLCRLFHARLPDGRSISSQLVLLGPHPVTHTVCAAADEEFLKMGATAFLRWRSFEALAKMGYEGNDLTDAALNPVTRFKSQLGGDLQLALMAVKPSFLSLGRECQRYLRYCTQRKP